MRSKRAVTSPEAPQSLNHYLDKWLPKTRDGGMTRAELSRRARIDKSLLVRSRANGRLQLRNAVAVVTVLFEAVSQAEWQELFSDSRTACGDLAVLHAAGDRRLLSAFPDRAFQRPADVVGWLKDHFQCHGLRELGARLATQGQGPISHQTLHHAVRNSASKGRFSPGTARRLIQAPVDEVSRRDFLLRSLSVLGLVATKDMVDALEQLIQPQTRLDTIAPIPGRDALGTKLDIIDRLSLLDAAVPRDAVPALHELASRAESIDPLLASRVAQSLPWKLMMEGDYQGAAKSCRLLLQRRQLNPETREAAQRMLWISLAKIGQIDPDREVGLLQLDESPADYKPVEYSTHVAEAKGKLHSLLSENSAFPASSHIGRAIDLLERAGRYEELHDRGRQLGRCRLTLAEHYIAMLHNGYSRQTSHAENAQRLLESAGKLLEPASESMRAASDTAFALEIAHLHLAYLSGTLSPEEAEASLRPRLAGWLRDGFMERVGDSYMLLSLARARADPDKPEEAVGSAVRAILASPQDAVLERRLRRHLRTLMPRKSHVRETVREIRGSLPTGWTAIPSPGSTSQAFLPEAPQAAVRFLDRLALDLSPR